MAIPQPWNMIFTTSLALIFVMAFAALAKAEDAGSANPLRIAVVQQDANPGKTEENRNKALRFAQDALDQGADLVLFHEELVAGYVQDPRKLAEPVDGPTTQAFQDLLRGRKSLIIYGLTEKKADKYFISATVVSSEGVLANYHKSHLWWKATGPRHEPTFYTPGNQLVTFTISGYKCGLMICYDGDFPEMTRAYANRGCEVLLWMNNRGSRGHEEVKELAYRNSIIIGTSCCCGTNENGDACPGGSNITDATGKLLADIWNREGIIVRDVFPAEVPRLREQNPWYRGQRPELYR